MFLMDLSISPIFSPAPSLLSFVLKKKTKKKQLWNYLFFYLPIAFSQFQNRVINTNTGQTRKAFGKRNEMHWGNVEKVK